MSFADSSSSESQVVARKPVRKARPRHKRTDEFMARGDLSPAAIFAEFRGLKPPRLFQYLDDGVQRICKVCMVWKPRERFRGARVGGAPRWECKDCMEARRTAWAEKNPDRIKAHRRKKDENEKVVRAFARNFIGRRARKDAISDMDVVRKAMIQRPKELSTEDEAAAYFRGFIAGAKRSLEESERFDRLKDLCHRVAAEGGIYGHHFEERVSAAYEGLLNFIRKKPALKQGWTLEHERKIAAQAIRYALADDARATGPRTRDGGQRYTPAIGTAAEDWDPTDDVGAGPEEQFGGDLWNELEAVMLAGVRAGDVDERIPTIVRMRLQECTFKEIGAELGVTESRACQIWNDHAPWMAQNCAKLTGLDAFIQEPSGRAQMSSAGS